MSRFARIEHGPLMMLNVDKIVSVYLNEDFDENHEPTVDVYFSNHPGERPLRLSWIDWEAVHAKMVERPKRNTRKEH